MSDFESQYLYTSLRTDAEIKADELAKQYYQDAEAYDRTVCSGPIIKGIIMPNTPWESDLVNRNARALRSMLWDTFPKFGITEDVMEKALRDNCEY